MNVIINPVVKTQPYMNVSTMSSSDFPGRVVLQLHRHYEGLIDPRTKMRVKIKYGDHHGKVFDSSEKAFDFAADRGYLMEFYPRQ